MKFDDILEHHVGEFGPYQKFVYVTACLPSVAAAFLSLLPVFMLATPKHRCRLPGMDNDTYEVQSMHHQSLINTSIPWELKGEEPHLSSCLFYSNFSTSFFNGTDPLPLKTDCHSWVYDESKYMSAVQDFDMVCGQSAFQSHFKMIAFIGSLCGALLNGVLSDLFGRKRVFLSCVLVTIVVTAIQLLSPVYWIFLATRFVQGLAGSGVFSVSFVYMMEVVGPNYRMFAGIFIELFWCLGLFILVGAAYWIRFWKFLVLTMVAPAFLFFFYIWILPESPRWLMSVGKHAEANKILQKIASSNKRALPQYLLETVAKEENKAMKKESAQVWKLFSHKVLLLRTAILAFNRYALDLSYFGMSLNVEHLSGSLYLNYTLSSVVETAAIIMVLFLIFRWGRKPLFCGTMVLGAVGFLLSTVPNLVGDQGDQVYATGLVMVGKFGITAAYAVSYVYCSEIFPTSLRSSALALIFIVGMIGATVSPYVVEMSKSLDGPFRDAFPMLVFGTVALLSGLLSLLLPETKDKVMPENIQDAVKFGISAESAL